MRKGFAVFGIVTALTLCGCGAVLPEMTDEEAKKIGEYAALTLLRYDANYRSRLVDLSQVQEPEEIVPEPVQPEEVIPEEPQEEVAETPVIEIGEDTSVAESLESYLELPEGVRVVYAGESVCQSYPEDGSDFFALEASEGKSLLVLQFIIQNNSGADQTIDLLHRRDNYRVTINGDYKRTALTTMLPNDMVTYLDTIKSGDSANVVVLLEVDAAQAQDLSSIVLNWKNDVTSFVLQVM